MRAHHSCLLSVILASTSLTAPLAAYAASDEPFKIEEIIVTATKREETLQTVPVTVQAFTGNLLNTLGAQDLTQVAGKIPGFAFQDQGPGDRKFVIRGVNSRGEATTGVYFGEAIITGSNKQDGGGRQADIELHDLARIEILKGPQGTLFGASSMSGTVRYIPNDPDLQTLSGRAEVEALTIHRGGQGYRANGAINLPIVEDKLAVRGVAWMTRDDGFVDNVRLGLNDINSNHTTGGRLMIKGQLTDNFSLTGMAVYQKRKSGGSSRVNLGELQPAYEQILINSGPGFAPLPVRGNYSNQDFTVNNWDEDLQIYSAVAKYDAGFGSFLATTNYFKRDIDYRFDSTPIVLALGAPATSIYGTPAAALTFQPQTRDVWSNEVRFSSSFDGPLQLVAGGFLSREKSNFEVEVLGVGANGLPVGPWDPHTDFYIGPKGAAVFGRAKHDSLNQEAVFGELNFSATDKLTLTVGARYFQYKLTSDAVETKPFVGFPPNNNPAFSVATKHHKTTFRFNASYKATDDLMIYATAAQGFRIGGTNDNAINPASVNVPASFGPDNLWSYELGWKSRMADDRITFNGAFYAIRWRDIQVGDFNPSSPFPFVQNAGKASVDGAEVEVSVRPIRGLDISFGGSWQSARLTQDFPGGSILGLSGDRVPNVPKVQFGSGIEYSWGLTDALTASVRGDLTYRGATDTLFRTEDAYNVHLPSYTLIDLQASIAAGHWQVTAYVKNLTDKLALYDAINSVQDPLAYFVARPRTFGVRAAVNF
ncbi:TonB-dependent receptor [Govanella unica]|uniref:TonB-dependent receptor n=1 Tax=Govanella unica TaxID=2975056 RepID=A0A9X3TX26_9PROT|nr:TonB-dependent receptor [Govania unica]MDA5193272.1 TonB-dependent receptor [Govania unica]